MTVGTRLSLDAVTKETFVPDHFHFTERTMNGRRKKLTRGAGHRGCFLAAENARTKRDMNLVDQPCHKKGTKDLRTTFADESKNAVLFPQGDEHLPEVNRGRVREVQGRFRGQRVTNALWHARSGEYDDRRKAPLENFQRRIQSAGIC